MSAAKDVLALRSQMVNPTRPMSPVLYRLLLFPTAKALSSFRLRRKSDDLWDLARTTVSASIWRLGRTCYNRLALPVLPLITVMPMYTLKNQKLWYTRETLRREQRNGRVVHTLFGHNKHSMRTGNCKVQLHRWPKTGLLI